MEERDEGREWGGEGDSGDTDTLERRLLGRRLLGLTV